MREQSQLGIALTLAVCLAACDGGPVRVSVRPVPDSLAQQLQRVEVSVIDSCDAQTLGEPPVSAEVTVEATRAMPAMELGGATRGPHGLYARGWDEGCEVIAAGCDDVEIGNGDLEVIVAPVSGPGCAASETCVAQRCVARADAGAPDAGLDAGTADAGPPADGGLDAGTDAGPPVLACRPTAVVGNPEPFVVYEMDPPDDETTVHDVSMAAPRMNLTGFPVPGGSGLLPTLAGSEAVFGDGYYAAGVTESDALTMLLTSAQALSVEVWFTVRDLVIEEPAGPERVVSLSRDAAERGFTIGVNQDLLVFRLTTSLTNLNGTTCTASSTPTAFETSVLTAGGPPVHAVLTYDATNGARAYVNGSQVAWTTCAGTPTLDWPTGLYQLVLGDELGTDRRTFDGAIQRVQIYGRALSATEIACWYGRGPDAPVYE